MGAGTWDKMGEEEVWEEMGGSRSSKRAERK